MEGGRGGREGEGDVQSKMCGQVVARVRVLTLWLWNPLRLSNLAYLSKSRFGFVWQGGEIHASHGG